MRATRPIVWPNIGRERSGLTEDPGQDRVVPYLFPHPGLLGDLPLVDPAATPTGTSRSDDLAWHVPAAATALLVPAALLALRRRTRR